MPRNRLTYKKILAAAVLAWSTLLLGSTVVATPHSYPQDEEKTIVPGAGFFENNVLPILEKHCFECHGGTIERPAGELALVSRKSMLKGGESGPAVDLQQPSKSILLDAINYNNYEMPPDGKLEAKEIEVLTRWVESGTPWPESLNMDTVESAGKSTPQVNDESKSFWSFKKVSRPKLPDVKNQVWVSNPIDHFILARLENAGLPPARAAEKQTMIRRLYYDLTGLPPTIDQVNEFVNNESENAYQDLVDYLLDSRHYGEKWGRHWLDLVRYAESNSFERDGTKPYVWRYRDYVIRSFNEDKPYDQFLTEQLAGDELDEPTAESIIATGYYRLGQWDDEPADRKQARFDDLDDILATTSQAMLGLTINCARCHDHKIDPVPTEDYYRMLALFANVRRYGVRDQESILNQSTCQLEHDSPPPANVIDEHNRKIDQAEASMQGVIAIAKLDFEPVELEDFAYVENHERLIHKRLENKTITQQQFDQFINARNELNKLKSEPPNLYRVLCVTENQGDEQDTRILIRGNPHFPGKQVEPGFVSVLSPPEPSITKPKSGKSTGRRLALAKWITSEDNPLTARVMVNRIWQHHFGRGIVRSSNDFGFQGNRPTHPELLDYLASRFVECGWKMKEIHRLILMSSTYQMGGGFDSPSYDADPRNDLLWRFEMRRLSAEEIRDSILAVSGRLNSEKMFGPSVYTTLSKEVLAGQSMPGAGWGESPDEDSRRRSIYIHVKRSLRVPMLEAFDSADTDFSCPVRFHTTQPTQALALLNSDFVMNEARFFAESVASQMDDLASQVREVLKRMSQREPSEQDVLEGVALIKSWIDEDKVEANQALELFCLTALNLNEFVFVE